MKTIKQMFCKHNGSWTYVTYNENLRVCLKCGWIDNGWMKKNREYLTAWKQIT